MRLQEQLNNLENKTTVHIKDCLGKTIDKEFYMFYLGSAVFKLVEDNKIKRNADYEEYAYQITGVVKITANLQYTFNKYREKEMVVLSTKCGKYIDIKILSLEDKIRVLTVLGF